MTAPRAPFAPPAALRPAALTSAALSLAVLTLAACSSGEPQPPAQTRPAPAAPRPAPAPAAPAPAPTDDSWIDAAVTPGLWVYRRDARGSIALFGALNAGAQVTLRCDRAARRIYLSRASSAAATVPLTVRSTTATETLPAQPTGGTPPYVAATLAPSAPILAALAYSRGRFAIDSADGRLVIPARPEFTRVVQDCQG